LFKGEVMKQDKAVSVLEMVSADTEHQEVEDNLMFVVRRIHHNHKVDDLGYCMDLHGAVQILDIFISNKKSGKGYIPNPSWSPRTSWISPDASIYIVMDRPRKVKITYAEAMKSVRRPCPDVCLRANEAGMIGYSHVFAPTAPEVEKVQDPSHNLFRKALLSLESPAIA